MEKETFSDKKYSQLTLLQVHCYQAYYPDSSFVSEMQIEEEINISTNDSKTKNTLK